MDTTVPVARVRGCNSHTGAAKRAVPVCGLRELDIHASSRSAACICRLRRRHLQELDLRPNVMGQESGFVERELRVISYSM